jgi:hypothetical protein
MQFLVQSGRYDFEGGVPNPLFRRDLVPSSIPMNRQRAQDRQS